MQLVKNPSVKPAAGMTRIKILLYVGQYSPGDIVDCSAEEAANLLSVGHTNDGTKVIEVRRAILLSDAQAQEEAPADLDSLAQDELEAMGRKNIVATPRDAAFEEKLRLMTQKKLSEENAPSFDAGKADPQPEEKGKKKKD
jgi:hypothetical protein